jgi:deoxyribose-phosphate aldolase
MLQEKKIEVKMSSGLRDRKNSITLVPLSAVPSLLARVGASSSNSISDSRGDYA